MTVYVDPLNNKEMSTPKTHELKTIPPFFDHIWNGNKSFELRENDRGFQVCDILYLREFIPSGMYTGRSIHARVDYVLEGFTGLSIGYCIMGITVLFRREQEQCPDCAADPACPEPCPRCGSLP